MFFKLLLSWLLLLTAAHTAETGLVIHKAQLKVLQNDTVKIEFSAAVSGVNLSSCRFMYSRMPAGDSLKGHSYSLSSYEAELEKNPKVFTFSPGTISGNQPQLNPGRIFYMLSCTDSTAGDFISLEYPLTVETNSKPSIITPGANVNTSAPVISWAQVEGVPAYHVIVSDQLIDFEEESMSITGISIIWQAITTNTSILYGSPNPSGSFSHIHPPPLSPGTQYTLILLNNYDGRSLLGTSEKVKDFRMFEFVPDETDHLYPPYNLTPVSGDTLNTSDNAQIKFSWHDSSKSASSYKLYVYSAESVQGFDNDILVPVWQTETTDTFAVLDARSTLSNKFYTYKIFATSSSGFTVVSDTNSFFYSTKTVTVNFSTGRIVKIQSLTDTLPLGDVKISINSLSGSQDILPLISDIDGKASRELPRSSYEILFKRTGYKSRRQSMDLENITGNYKVDVYLSQYPSQLNGLVLTESGIPISNAEITAINTFKQSYSAYTNADGYYQIGLEPGTYNVSANHSNYESSGDTTVSINQNENIYHGIITLNSPSSFLTGKVLLPDNSPLASAVLVLSNSSTGEIVNNQITGETGSFSIPLTIGSYTLSAEKFGFTAVQKSIDFISTRYIEIEMSPGASIIKGRVSVLIRTAPNFTSKTPYKGSVVTLNSPDGGAALTAITNSTGDFSFSVPSQGDYILSAGSSGKTTSISDTVRINKSKSTKTANLDLYQLAKLESIINFVPSVPDNLDSLVINLHSIDDGSLVKSAIPQQDGDSITLTFHDIPDGGYKISGGMPGYGLGAPVIITIKDNVWQTGHILTLYESSINLTIKPQRNQRPSPSNIIGYTPYLFSTTSRDTISSASMGEYTIDVYPANTNIIPLTEYMFTLDSAAPADTSIRVQLPFAHIPTDSTSYNNGELTVSFMFDTLFNQIDSAFVIYGYNQSMDTMRYSGPFKDTNTIILRPHESGGELHYYFAIYSGGLLYSNHNSQKQYVHEIPLRRILSYLSFSIPDTINLAIGQPARLTLHGYDNSGESLDTELDMKGKIKWTSGSGDIKIKNPDRRTVVLTANKKASDVILAAVKYKGKTISSSIAVRTVSGRINKLIITSTRDNDPEVINGEIVNFFIKAVDTTITPPRSITPNYKFTLNPPEAGKIMNNSLVLEPDFIGPLRIKVSLKGDDSFINTELGAQKDSVFRGLNITQVIYPNKPERTLFHTKSIELIIPDSSLAGTKQALLKMKPRVLPSHFISTKEIRLSSGLYEIVNTYNSRIAPPPLLKVALPEKSDENSFWIDAFSISELDWVKIPDSMSLSDSTSSGAAALSLALEYYEGYYFGLLSKTQPLQVSEFNIIPNPFSPLVRAERDGNSKYGARITFIPHSNLSSRVIVTLKIYNMRGELVRILERYKSQSKIQVDYYWDGKTDSGKWARNGRYLVVLIVKEATKRKFKKYIKPVVLFK